MSGIKWLPLESNPEVMNKFLSHLGVPSNFGISDIFSMDEELLSLVPKPSLALVLLFPATDEFCNPRKESPTSTPAEIVETPAVYFLKQTIKNACGTVALIHAVANNTEHFDLVPDSPLDKFLRATRLLTPDERAAYLEQNFDISAAHESTAQEGQSESGSADDDVTLHFVALVNSHGNLFELDGRRDCPVFHGKTSFETFFQDACEVCKEYMARDPDNVAFTALSFGALEE